MNPVIMFTATCDCGWKAGPTPKAGIEPSVKNHKGTCKLWVKS